MSSAHHDREPSPFDRGEILDPYGPNSPQLNRRSPRYNPVARAGFDLIQGWNDESIPQPDLILPSAEGATTRSWYSTDDDERLAELLGIKRQLILGEQATSEVAPPKKRGHKIAEVFVEFMAAISAAQVAKSQAEISEPPQIENAVEDPALEDRRETADWLADHAPLVLRRFESAASRLRTAEEEDDIEALSHATSSLRRALCALADAVFEPSSQPFIDSHGRERRVGPDEFKNRLIAFFEQNLPSGSVADLPSGEIRYLAERLDAIVKRLSAGVHADVAAHEVRYLYSATWMLADEVARIAL